MDELYEEMSRAAMARANLFSEIAIFWSMVVTVVGVLLVMLRALMG